MTTRKPLVVVNGQVEQLQSGDDIGSAATTETYFLLMIAEVATKATGGSASYAYAPSQLCDGGSASTTYSYTVQNCTGGKSV